MRRLIKYFCFLSLLFGTYLAWAQSQTVSSKEDVTLKQQGPESKVTLQQLGKIDFQAPTKFRNKIQRKPASADHSKARVYFYGACRTPYGGVYGTFDREYSDCLNEEVPYEDRGPYRAKFIGVGIHID